MLVLAVESFLRTRELCKGTGNCMQEKMQQRKFWKVKKRVLSTLKSIISFVTYAKEAFLLRKIWKSTNKVTSKI